MENRILSVIAVVVALAGAQLAAQGAPARAVPLDNAGFEADKLEPSWTTHVFGAQPEVALDATVRHGGRQSLRVKSGQLSDTAFGQEIQLQPGQWYRLTGWVRTAGLDPHAAPTCGTFQVQLPGGRGVVAAGRNHQGTADWTQETVYFVAPEGGRTRIAIFFVGYGQGTGTAWFDDLTLEEIDANVTTLTITDQPVCPGTISPYQYGQFIEYLCALTPSMFAEKLSDFSFEGVPPYGFIFRKELDRFEKPWYVDGAVHRGEFALDKTDPFNGQVSQRITQVSGDPATLGIAQNGVYVKAGEPLRCSLHLRAKGTSGAVRVQLTGEGQTYATAEFKPGEKWQRFEATITPSGTDNSATFTVTFRGPGTIWIDQLSLMPTDTVFGWRRDVAEALKALRPGIIRFGGSTTEGFDWTATIGDPAKRVPFTTCWGGLEPGNAGLEEFVQLCTWVQAEPLICVRFTGRKPKDAADQVEYFNGPADSPMGKLRAANGHPEPYHVRFWQIGNELGDETYQKGVADFCKAMKAVDSSIKLMAAFPSPGLLKNAGQYLDYICPHHYDIYNMQATAQDVEHCRAMIAENAPGRDIRLGITEWNTTAGAWELGRGMLWTLDNALACSRYQNLMHRNCDIMAIANRSNLTDSFCSGIIQTNNHALFKTPTYYAQELYATHAGQRPLKIELDGGLPFDQSLDPSATLSADGKTVAIFVVNTTNRTAKRTIDLKALAPLQPEVGVWILADTAKAGERDAVNSWPEPDRIRTQPAKATLTESKLAYEFPALSLAVMELHRVP